MGYKAFAGLTANGYHGVVQPDAVGSPGMLEHDVMENPLREALGQPFPRVKDGAFLLPDGPGLGVEPDLKESADWLMTRAEYRASKL
jgi:D-galactarolactone cycloisomerase